MLMYSVSTYYSVNVVFVLLKPAKLSFVSIERRAKCLMQTGGWNRGKQKAFFDVIREVSQQMLGMRSHVEEGNRNQWSIF